MGILDKFLLLRKTVLENVRNYQAQRPDHYHVNYWTAKQNGFITLTEEETKFYEECLNLIDHFRNK